MLRRRLLDWTENLNTGLYFAVKDSEGLHDAAVWVLDAWLLNRLVLKTTDPEVIPPGSPGLTEKDAERYLPWLPNRFDVKRRLKVKLPVAIYPNQFDRRIEAQRSCFTIHGAQKESLDKLFARTERLLAKIVIPSYATDQIRNELEDAGMDEATIYPDLVGLGKSAGRWLPSDEEIPHEGLYTRLKPSPIEGVGVFAIKDIKKGTLLFAGDSDEMRWVGVEDLPKEKHLKEFYDRFGVQKNGKEGRPKRYGCPRNFHRLTMSWYINDPLPGKKPNVRCDENYDFWALRDIKEGNELTVDSRTYSDHAGHAPLSAKHGSHGKKPKKGTA